MSESESESESERETCLCGERFPIKKSLAQQLVGTPCPDCHGVMSWDDFPDLLEDETTEPGNTCVRCGRVPPPDDPWHRGVGALSRTDNETYICSACGQHEALEDYFDHRLTPQSEWPISDQPEG